MLFIAVCVNMFDFELQAFEMYCSFGQEFSVISCFLLFFFLPRNMSSSQFCYSFLLKPFYCVEGLTLQKGNSSLLVLVDNGEFLNNATAAL